MCSKDYSGCLGYESSRVESDFGVKSAVINWKETDTDSAFLLKLVAPRARRKPGKQSLIPQTKLDKLACLGKSVQTVIGCNSVIRPAVYRSRTAMNSQNATQIVSLPQSNKKKNAEKRNYLNNQPTVK